MNKVKMVYITGFLIVILTLSVAFYQSYTFNENLRDYGLKIKPTVTLHMEVLHRDSTGKLISRTFHPMTIVNLGLNLTRDFAPYSLDYIGVSNDSSSVSVLWTVIPSEISDGGLARAQGSYLPTGNGTWNISKTFSVTATRSSKLYGLYRNATTNTLVAAEQQGVGAQKNMNNGDTLAVTVMATIS